MQSTPNAILDWPPGNETILVIDDEPSVRTFACHVLKRCGYTVLSAGHGPDALAVSDRFVGPIHLVLTDLTMPFMSIEELVEKLTARRPETHFLYFSGTFTEFDTETDGRDLMLKPVTSETLARKIRSILDAKVLASTR